MLGLSCPKHHVYEGLRMFFWVNLFHRYNPEANLNFYFCFFDFLEFVSSRKHQRIGHSFQGYQFCSKLLTSLKWFLPGMHVQKKRIWMDMLILDPSNDSNVYLYTYTRFKKITQKFPFLSLLAGKKTILLFLLFWPLLFSTSTVNEGSRMETCGWFFLKVYIWGV